MTYMPVGYGDPRPKYANGHVFDRFNTDDLETVRFYIVHCERRNLAFSTICAKLLKLSALAEGTGKARLFELDAEQIETYLDGLTGLDGGAIKATSRKATVSAFRSFYKWAVDFEHTNRDPMTKVVTPRVGRRLPSPMTENDYDLAVAAAPTPTMRLWVMLAGSAGLRVSEIAGLVWSRVDLYGRTINVIGKGDKERVVPMTVALARDLHVHQGLRTESDSVFTEPVFGRPYSAHIVSTYLGRYLREIGLDNRPHDLRHRFATEACESSGDIRAVQELMGHESIETTAVYTLVRDKRKRGVVDGMRDAA